MESFKYKWTWYRSELSIVALSNARHPCHIHWFGKEFQDVPLIKYNTRTHIEYNIINHHIYYTFFAIFRNMFVLNEAKFSLKNNRNNKCSYNNYYVVIIKIIYHFQYVCMYNVYTNIYTILHYGCNKELVFAQQF